MSPPRILAGALALWAAAGCVTLDDGAETAEGRRIPGKRLLQFAEYEHVCELTTAADVAELEHLLDRYGRNGWRLAGFLTRGGNTYAFCMVR